MTAKSKYDGRPDEELIERLRDGDEPIMEYICNKYKYLVRKEAETMFILGGDTDDLIQEGMVGLFKAIRDYDFTKEASFRTFASICIKRQIYNAVRAGGRKKNSPLNDYISYHSEKEDGNERGSFIEELAGNSQNPEQMILDKERIEYLGRRIEEELSALEKQVFDMNVEIEKELIPLRELEDANSKDRSTIANKAREMKRFI